MRKFTRIADSGEKTYNFCGYVILVRKTYNFCSPQIMTFRGQMAIKHAKNLFRDIIVFDSITSASIVVLAFFSFWFCL